MGCEDRRRCHAIFPNCWSVPRAISARGPSCSAARPAVRCPSRVCTLRPGAWRDGDARAIGAVHRSAARPDAGGRRGRGGRRIAAAAAAEQDGEGKKGTQEGAPAGSFASHRFLRSALVGTRVQCRWQASMRRQRRARSAAGRRRGRWRIAAGGVRREPARHANGSGRGTWGPRSPPGGGRAETRMTSGPRRARHGC